MKIAAFVPISVFSLALAFSSHQQQRPGPRTLESVCDDQHKGLASGAYVFAVIRQVWPPTIPRGGGISIAVVLRPAQKVILHTDGSKFQLWIGNLHVPEGSVWVFLGNLADSCSLPADPAEAVKLLQMGWESRELQKPEFDRLHTDFMKALSQYVESVQERSRYFMAAKRYGGGVDASRYLIVYDNSWQHLEIDEWNLPINGKTTSMINFVKLLKSDAEQRFGRTLGEK
jgi:hypothetical protein